MNGVHANEKHTAECRPKAPFPPAAFGMDKHIRTAHVRSIISNGKENTTRRGTFSNQEKILAFNFGFAKKKELSATTSNLVDHANKPAIRSHSCQPRLPSVPHSLQPCFDMTNIKTYKKPIKQQKVLLPERASSRRRHHSDSAAKNSTKMLYDSLGGVVLNMSKAKVYRKKASSTSAAETRLSSERQTKAETSNQKGYPQTEDRKSQSLLNRSVPRNPSYLAAIEEALKLHEQRTAKFTLKANNDAVNYTLKNQLITRGCVAAPQVACKDACTTTDDLVSPSKDAYFNNRYSPRTTEKSWKRLNILHLLGSDCDKDLSVLCQMVKDGRLTGKYGEEVTGNSTVYHDPGNGSHSSSGISSLCCDSTGYRPSSRLGSAESSIENQQQRELCGKCQTRLVPCRDSSTIIDSLNDSAVPNYNEPEDENFSYGCNRNLFRRSSLEDQESQSSMCVLPEKYDKFAESYKQNLMVICKTCEFLLPLPHRLSLKLNCGMGIEFSHGNSEMKRWSNRLSLVPLSENFSSQNNINDLRLSCGSCANTITDPNEAFLEFRDERLLVNKQNINHKAKGDYEQDTITRSLSAATDETTEENAPTSSKLIHGAIEGTVHKWMFDNNERISIISDVENENDEIVDEVFEPLDNGFVDNCPDNTGDFSQICVVKRDVDQDLDDTSTLCSAQFWQESSSDSSSSDSDQWKYDEQSDDSSSSNSGEASPNLTVFNASSLNGSRHWSLEALPSRSFFEPNEPDSLVYKGYYKDIAKGKGVVVELPPRGRKSSITKPVKERLKRSWSLSDITGTPSSAEVSPKCLCNLCTNASSVQWPSSITEQESDSEIKAAFSNPVYGSVPNGNGNGTCSLEYEYSTSIKGPEAASIRRHSTPQKEQTRLYRERTKFSHPSKSRQQVVDDAVSEDLQIYFWNVHDGGNQVAMPQTVPALKTVNGHDSKLDKNNSDTSDKQVGFTPKSLQCCCWSVHREWDQVRHDPTNCAKLVSCNLFHNHVPPVEDKPAVKPSSKANHRKGLQFRKAQPAYQKASPKKYKAKDVIANKAQIKLAVYMNSGHLTVHVMTARKVTSRFILHCNPYVKVSLFPHHPSHAPCRTRVVECSQCPVFDEKFSFELSPGDCDKRILVSLWHRDVCVERSEFLGCMSFGIKRILTKGPVSGWYRVLTEALGRAKHFQVRPMSSADPGDVFY